MKRLYVSALATFAVLAASANSFDFGALTGTVREARSAMAAAQTTTAPRLVRAAAEAENPSLSEPSKDMPYITEQPAGTAVQYIRSGHAVALIWDYLVNTTADGRICTVVTDDAGNIYIHPVSSQKYTEGWLAGKIADGVATFELPQQVGYAAEISENLYALKLTYSAEAQDMLPSENQTLRLSINADGTITSLEEETDGPGLCTWLDGGADFPSKYMWEGFWDSFASMKPFDLKIAEIPASVKMEDWYMLDGVTASKVSVGFEGDKVYFKGICSELPDGVCVGTLSDGKVTVPSGQFQGIYEPEQCVTYAIGAFQEYDYWTDWFTYTYADSFVFEYDAEARTLSAGDYSILFGMTPDNIEDNNYTFYYDSPYLKYQSADTEITEIDAPILMYNETSPSGMMMAFIIPVVTESGIILDSSCLYYQIMVDGQPMVFSPEVYNDIEAQTTMIPFGYSTGTYGNFYLEGAVHMLMVYGQDFNSLGVRAVYKNGDKEVFSPVSYLPGYSALKGIQAGASVEQTEYFDLQGRRIAEPSNGLFIRRSTLSDGTITTEKVMR